MATARPAVPLDRLRELIRARLAEGSIRGVAREIGMPPNGLTYFLEGGAPREATLRKLEAWFIAEAARRIAEFHRLEGWFLQAAARTSLDPGTEVAEAALSVLARHLPAPQQAAAQARLVALVEELSREAGVPSPPWLRVSDGPPRDG